MTTQLLSCSLVAEPVLGSVDRVVKLTRLGALDSVHFSFESDFALPLELCNNEEQSICNSVASGLLGSFFVLGDAILEIIVGRILLCLDADLSGVD